MQHPRHRGFTLIELILVVAIIGFIAAMVAYGQRTTQEKRRDVKRVSDINELQKGLSLYVAQTASFPVMTGCITGTDLVSTELVAKGLLGGGNRFADPSNPTNTASCYYYVSNGSTYTLRYTLEQTSNAGTAGTHTVQP